MWKPIRFLKLKIKKILVPVLIVGSHMGENLKNQFSAYFSHEMRKLGLNVRTAQHGWKGGGKCLYKYSFVELLLRREGLGVCFFGVGKYFLYKGNIYLNN